MIVSRLTVLGTLKRILTTSTFSIENNKLVMKSLEEQFRVELETGYRTPADHQGRIGLHGSRESDGSEK